MEEKVNGNVIREKVVVENTPPVVEVVKPVEKKHEGFPKVVAIVLFVIILAMAGFMVWHFMTANHEVKECETPKDEEPSQPVVVSPSEEWENDVRVREVVAALREKAESLTAPAEYNGAARLDIINVYDGSYLAYKPDGLNTAVDYDRTYGFIIEEVNNKTLYDIVMDGRLGIDLAEVLVQRGFTKTEEIMGSVLYKNPTTDIICMVTSGLPFGVTCAHVSWYNKENVAFLNNLAEAYKEKEGEYPYYVSADEANVVDSGYESYQRLQGSLMGSVALFFRTSPEAQWQFFTGTQAVLSCGEYNTDDLKKAFAGEVCYDETKGANSKVEF